LQVVVHGTDPMIEMVDGVVGEAHLYRYAQPAGLETHEELIAWCLTSGAAGNYTLLSPINPSAHIA
jgi:hypothetical protein